MTYTAEQDLMSKRLREEIAADYSAMDTDDLYDLRDRTASHYMIYAVKPLDGYSDRSTNANTIRAQRQELLRQLWLRLEDECSTR